MECKRWVKITRALHWKKNISSQSPGVEVEQMPLSIYYLFCLPNTNWSSKYFHRSKPRFMKGSEYCLRKNSKKPSFAKRLAEKKNWRVLNLRLQQKCNIVLYAVLLSFLQFLHCVSKKLPSYSFQIVYSLRKNI